MTVLQTDDIREKPRRRLSAKPGNLAAAFARAALLGGFCVVGVSGALPGAAPAAIAIATALYLMAATGTGWLIHLTYPHNRLGAANYVTLARLVLVSALLAWLISGGGPSWAIVAISTLALALDGVDGWFARRQNLVSDFGARFDIEVDSVFALSLAINAAWNPQIGVAVILLGLPRYAFVIAGLALPWMRRDLPERFSRKCVSVVQLAFLIALQVPGLPVTAAMALIALAAIALVWSFAIDIVWLHRLRK